MPPDLSAPPLDTDSEDPISRIVQIIIDAIDPDTIILFGSHATGKENPDSDYGICALKTGIEGRRKISKLLNRAFYGLTVPVELLVETPESLSTHKTNPHLIYREIDRKGKIIYEKAGERE